MRMNSLQGIFDTRRTLSKRNFIQENVKQLRTMRKAWVAKEKTTSLPRKSTKFQHVVAKVPAHITSSTVYKNRDTSQEADGARSIDIPSRTSILSSLSAVRNSGLRSRKSNAQAGTKSPLLQRSRIHPTSGDKPIIVPVEDDKKVLKSDSTLQRNTDSTINRLSAMSLSGSPVDTPKPQCESVLCSLSEHSMNVPPLRSLGCQTVSPEDLESLYNEGVIKYPSDFNVETVRTESSYRTPRAQTSDSCQQTDTFAVKLPPLVPDTGRTFSNPIPMDDITSYGSELQNTAQLQPLHERLLDRYKGSSTTIWKSHLPNTENQKNNGPVREDVKEKHVNEGQKQFCNFEKLTQKPSSTMDNELLPESQRLEILRELQKSYEDHIRQLNSLPVKTDTLKMRHRKIYIEKQLIQLEEDIKTFSRPNVFI